MNWKSNVAIIAGILILAGGCENHQTKRGPHSLSVIETRLRRWDFDGSDGPVVTFSTVLLRDGRLPRHLTMYAGKTVALKDWDVIRVDGYERCPLTNLQLPMEPGPYLYADEDRWPLIAEIRDIDPGGVYDFDVYLHCKEKCSAGKAYLAAKEGALRVFVLGP